MNQIQTYEILKEKLGEEVAKAIIEYIEFSKKDILTTEVFFKSMDLFKSEIISKIEELRLKTEKDKAEILAK
ncbi:MAG: hypothetical protein RMJ45_09040, partial [Candidatus Calescibacterium sp.]|nr:hypothetical protein [Candidatus Calescibacterium sp.]